MRERLWYELVQAKHNHLYCVYLMAWQRRFVSYFNMAILVFSTSGILGWPFFKTTPLLVCVIVSALSLIRILSPHFVPSEKQIDKLDQMADFYFNYFNCLEKIWLDFDKNRISEDKAQTAFYKLKDTEREINKKASDVIKSTFKRIAFRADAETRSYMQRTFN